MYEPLAIPKTRWRSRWLVLPSWGVLHRVAKAKWNGRSYVEANGTTVCGRRGILKMPGLVSRQELKRCATCCAALGIPIGAGAPFNDEHLTPRQRGR